MAAYLPVRGRYERRARAAYFIVVRESYESAAAGKAYQPVSGALDILKRAPLRAPEQSADDYEEALGAAISWSDCFALERETVDACGDAELAQRLRGQRVRYSQMATADEFGAYMKGAIDLDRTIAAAPVPYDRLRSELGMITDRIAYLLTTSAPKENIRSWLTIWTVAMMFASMAVIFGTYYALYHSRYSRFAGQLAFEPAESLFVVLFAGLIGGFVSVQQRLQTPTLVDPLYKRFELQASGLSIVVSPVIGMVFACVFFAIMLGGFVSGSVFPAFTCPDSPKLCDTHDLASFAAGATPADVASWAKLTVWAFAAGFLERLVPDILTRLGTVATSGKTS